MRRGAPTLLALAAVLLTGCSGGGGTATPSPTVSPSTSPGPTATARPTPSATPSPSPSPSRTPSALDDLQPYLDAARATDTRIAVAARKVNGGFRPTYVQFDRATVQAVKDIRPERAAEAIPPGLPVSLLRRVLVVQGDLVGRARALSRVRIAGERLELAEDRGKDLLRCLAGGRTLAARFQSDVAALEAAARTTPHVRRAGPRTRAAVELAVRLEDMALFHGGCDQCGAGRVETELLPLTFSPRPTIDWPHDEEDWVWFGTIRTVPFRARWDFEVGWTVQLNAC